MGRALSEDLNARDPIDWPLALRSLFVSMRLAAILARAPTLALIEGSSGHSRARRWSKAANRCEVALPPSWARCCKL